MNADALARTDRRIAGGFRDERGCRGGSRFIDLDELHQAIHPGPGVVGEGSPSESDDDMGPSPIDLSTPDLDDLADRDRLEASKVEHPLEDEVRRLAHGPIWLNAHKET